MDIIFRKTSTIEKISIGMRNKGPIYIKLWLLRIKPKALWTIPNEFVINNTVMIITDGKKNITVKYHLNLDSLLLRKLLTKLNKAGASITIPAVSNFAII